MQPTPHDPEKYILLYQQITQALVANQNSEQSTDTQTISEDSLLDDDAQDLEEIKKEIETILPDIESYHSFEDCYADQMSALPQKKIEDIHKFQSDHKFSSKVVEENTTLQKILADHACSYRDFVEGKPRYRFFSSSAMKNTVGELEPDSTKSQSLSRNLAFTAVSGVIALAAVGVLAASVFFSGGLTLPLIGIALPSLSSVPFLTTAAMVATPFSIVATGLFGSRFITEKNTDINSRKQAFQQARKEFLGENPNLNDLRQDPLYVQEQSETPKPILNFINPLHARTLKNKDPSKRAPSVTTNRGRQIAQVLLAVVVVAAVAFFTGGLGLLPALPLLPAAMSTLATMATTGLSTLGITGLSISANTVAATLGGAAFLGYSTSKYSARHNESTIQQACNHYVSDIEKKHQQSENTPALVDSTQAVREALDTYLEKNRAIKEKLTAVAKEQYQSQNQDLFTKISDNIRALENIDKKVSTYETQANSRIHIHEKIDILLKQRELKKAQLGT